MPEPADPLDDTPDADDTLDDADLDDDDRRRKSPVRPSDWDRAIADQLRHLSERERYSYRTLAEAIRPADDDETWTKSRLQRLLTATRRFTLTELADILHTLDEDRTRFLARVGYITLSDDLRERVAHDVWLDPGERRGVLAIIDNANRRAGRDAPAN